MNISYIGTYIIYKLRAREEINGLGRSDRRGLLMPPELPDALIQRIPFPGHVINDHDFGMALKRVQDAPQRFGRGNGGMRD